MDPVELKRRTVSRVAVDNETSENFLCVCNIRVYRICEVCYPAIGDPATTGRIMVRDAEVPTRVTW